MQAVCGTTGTHIRGETHANTYKLGLLIQIKILIKRSILKELDGATVEVLVYSVLLVPSSVAF